MTPHRISRLSAALCLVLSGCAVGPDYHRPAAPVGTAYKEAGDWKTAAPADGQPRGPWWSVFKDPVLDGLMNEVDHANQSLIQAEAAYRQERAIVGEARASFFPTLTAGASATRGSSGISSARGAAAGTGVAGASAVPGAAISHSVTVQLDASWEPDLWGGVRRQVESSEANEAASAATFYSTRLSLESSLATDYFQLRGLDATAKVLTETVAAYQKALQLTQNQYRVGVAQLSDVVQAQTLLVSTQAQLVNVGVQRSELEHAIAVLTGKPPSEVKLDASPLTTDQIVPTPPPGVPSQLLERRPDVASAERTMQSANAQIGVATAAFFPNLTLSAAGGYTNSSLSRLFTLPNRFWSLGPDLAGTLFDGGLRYSELQAAHAVYDQNVASYRQTVLTAIQQVEDALSSVRILDDEYKLQVEAVRLAQRSVDLELNRYKAGTVSYSDVITTQTTLLSNQETQISLLSQRVAASVALIKALGGGWTMSDLDAAPSVAQDESANGSKESSQ